MVQFEALEDVSIPKVGLGFAARKKIIAWCFFLLIAITALIFMPKSRTPNQSIAKIVESREKIAIIPFTDLSSDESLRYISHGLREELLTSIIKLENLDVITLARSNLTASNLESLPDLHLEKEVDYLLTGTVRSDSLTVQVVARLLDVKKEKFIWAQRFQRDRIDILSIQSDLAQAILSGVPARFGDNEKTIIKKLSEVDPEAYRYYFMGAYWSNFNPDEANNAVGYLAKAIEIDSNFALPYLSLANHEWITATFGQGDPLAHWTNALDYVKKAISLDSLNASAWNTYGLIQHNFLWDYEAAEKSFLRMRVLDPQLSSIDYLWFLHLNGRQVEVMDILSKEGYETNQVILGIIFLHIDQLEKAWEILNSKKNLSNQF